MPLRPRLLRTYSRRAGYLRPLPPPDSWISPPQDRKRLFSSSSAVSSATSPGSSGFSEDPDFSPPRKRPPQAAGELRSCTRRLRTRRNGARSPAGKENREPGQEPRGRRKKNREPSLSSPSPSPPRCSRRRRQDPPVAERRPLLCSTPQWAGWPRRRPLAPLNPGTDSGSGSGSGLGPPPRRRRGLPVRLSSLLLSTTIESGSGIEDTPPCPAQSRQEGAGGSGGAGAGPRERCRALRSSVRGPCGGRAAVSPQEAPSPARAEPQPPAAAEPREDPAGGSPKRSSSGPRGRAEGNRLVPVVLLDPREVPRSLARMKMNRKADAQPACLQPASPVGRQRIWENKFERARGVPAEGSSCRKACISGFSASRWGRNVRLAPVRHNKMKRKQQPNNSFFRPRAKPKQTQACAVEMSVDGRDNDYSLLTSSYSWARFRASLSFHKKKKVTTDDGFCSSSILCTPSSKSQLSRCQGSLSAGKAQGYSCSASSLVLLTPRSSSSVLELMLTDAEKVFGECHQKGPIAFEECIPLDKMKDCKKIGEGVFGEVFQIDSERGPAALKIIPIEGTEKVNGEVQKTFGEILPEVIISKELSLLSEESVNRTVGFISLYSVHCVQGAYPKYLLKAWDKYHKETGSENDRPDLFGDEQLFMVLEFEFGGHDLEHMRHSFSSVASAKSILHQVTASLAVAEQELHFEHRDLHWGNVLVKKTDAKELHYVLNGATHSIPTAGYHVNIIDYTLSRLEKDGLTVFCDLSTDEELFQGTGDYQFDIYRQMKAENSNSWTDYHPHSNVLWLHYLADKFLNDMRYKTKTSQYALKRIKTQLNKFRQEVLTFESACDVLHNSSLFQ